MTTGRTHTRRIRYPRTLHLPWSPGATSDDRVMSDSDLDTLRGLSVVVTEKMDGENTTMYRGCVHARSLETAHHPSRDWVKKLHGQVAWEIPEGWRVCGENLYAEHSIHYRGLESYFYAFSVWDEQNVCLSWDETVEWARLLGLCTVPVLWRGAWDEEAILRLGEETAARGAEGYVVRAAGSFPYAQFHTHVAKFVRKGHVTTDQHWMSRAVIPNELREKP